MKVRISCNYILPEHEGIVSLVFQTEPKLSWIPVSHKNGAIIWQVSF